MKKFYIFLLIVFLNTLAQAGIKYSEKTLNTFSEVIDSKANGKIFPTTPLVIIKIDGDKALVKLTGWNRGELKRILYYSKGKRIISAVFFKKAHYKYKVLHTDTVGIELWKKVEILTWINNKNITENIKDLYTEANRLYQVSCGVCHAAHQTKEYSANQWPAVIKGMIDNTPLDKEQGLLITQFTQKHAKN